MNNENQTLEQGFEDIEYNTKNDWELFVHGKLISFMQANGIEVITVDTKKGQKSKVTRGKNGEWKTVVTYQETL